MNTEINADAASTVNIRGNGKMTCKFQLAYRDDNTLIADLQSLLGLTTVDNPDYKKVNKPMIIPTIYSVNLNITGSHPPQQVQTGHIATTILQCIVSSYHYLTNVCITADSNTYEGRYSFKSALFNTMSNEYYVITPESLESFMETSTGDRLTHSTVQGFGDSLRALLNIIGSSSIYIIQHLDYRYQLYCSIGYS